MIIKQRPCSWRLVAPVFAPTCLAHLLSLILVVLACACADAARSIDIIGHRGNSGEAPENTLVSLHQAFDRFAVVVEADIRSSADGTAWLMHDNTVDRTTNGTGSINSLSDAAIQSLDAGSWFGPEFADEKPPTLTEALQATAGRGALFLDLKETGLGPAIEDAVIASEFDTSDLWLWVGTNTSYAVDLHARFPDGKILWGGDEIQYLTNPSYFDDLRNAGVWGFDVVYGSLNADFVAAAKDEGFYVSTYTINSVQDMLTAIEMGVDGMETDFPLRLYSLFDLALDLDGDDAVNAADWQALRLNQFGDLTDLPLVERYKKGDLNLDGKNNHADFVLFKNSYELMNGAGSFSQLTSAVPEPRSQLWILIALGAAIQLVRDR